MSSLGRLAYGASVAGMGVLCLIAGDLGYVFQPVPKWMPLASGLAYASGAVMLAGGAAVLVPRTARLAGGVLAVHFALWLLLFSVPATVARPALVGNWEGCGLNLTVVAGGWLLALAGGGERGVSLARRVYAVALPLIGLAHFGNAEAAMGYVPTWFPLRIDWVYLTGAGHVAAGLAILFGVAARLAAVLEAAQITAFVVIAHIPAVCRAPGDRLEWAQLAYAVAIGGAAWLVAATFSKSR